MESRARYRSGGDFSRRYQGFPNKILTNRSDCGLQISFKILEDGTHEENPKEHDQYEKEKDTRLPRQNGDQGRKAGSEQEKGEGEKETCRLRFPRRAGEGLRAGLIGTKKKGGPVCLKRMKRQSFGKDERILKRKEFMAVYDQGKRLSSENFIVLLSPNPSGIRRLGLTVSKKIGMAVRRNRIKRLLREFFRLHKDRLPPGQDMVIIARKDASSRTYDEVRRELEDLLKSCGRELQKQP
jgi:ribonuclease P protein component